MSKITFEGEILGVGRRDKESNRMEALLDFPRDVELPQGICAMDNYGKYGLTVVLPLEMAKDFISGEKVRLTIETESQQKQSETANKDPCANIRKAAVVIVDGQSYEVANHTAKDFYSTFLRRKNFQSNDKTYLLPHIFGNAFIAIDKIRQISIGTSNLFDYEIDERRTKDNLEPKPAGIVKDE